MIGREEFSIECTVLSVSILYFLTKSENKKKTALDFRGGQNRSIRNKLIINY